MKRYEVRSSQEDMRDHRKQTLFIHSLFFIYSFSHVQENYEQILLIYYAQKTEDQDFLRAPPYSLFCFLCPRPLNHHYFQNIEKLTKENFWKLMNYLFSKKTAISFVAPRIYVFFQSAVLSNSRHLIYFYINNKRL